MPKSDETMRRRALASLRMRACGTGLCAGATVFLLGAGLAVPLGLNGAWLSGLAAVPGLAAWAALVRRMARRRMTRFRAALCAAAFFCCAVFACAALCALAEAALLPLARGLHAAFVTAALCALCAACGAGVWRVCFLLRAALPLAMIVCAAASLSDKSLSGLFPLLGNGAARLGLSALLLAAGGLAPALLLLFPPEELEGMEGLGGMENASCPGAGFYALRMAAGAMGGCALMLLLCGGATPQTLSGAAGWGGRLALIAGGGAHQGLADTALLLLLCIASALLAACMLAACGRSMRIALPRAGKHAAPRVVFVLLLGALAALTAWGMDHALLLPPAAALPAIIALIMGEKNRKGEDAA